MGVVMERCCCCRVRTACLILGSLYLLGSLSSIGNGVQEIMKKSGKSKDDYQIEVESMVEDMNSIGYLTTNEQMEEFLSMASMWNIVGIVLSVILVITSGLLLYGVHAAKDKFLLPTLVFFPVDSIVKLGLLIQLAIAYGFTHPFAMIFEFVFIVSIVCNIFIWLCVFSHRQQLKTELLPSNDSSMKP